MLHFMWKYSASKHLSFTAWLQLACYLKACRAVSTYNDDQIVREASVTAINVSSLQTPYSTLLEECECNSATSSGSVVESCWSIPLEWPHRDYSFIDTALLCGPISDTNFRLFVEIVTSVQTSPWLCTGKVKLERRFWLL